MKRDTIIFAAILPVRPAFRRRTLLVLLYELEDIPKVLFYFRYYVLRQYTPRQLLLQILIIPSFRYLRAEFELLQFYILANSDFWTLRYIRSLSFSSQFSILHLYSCGRRNTAG